MCVSASSFDSCISLSGAGLNCFLLFFILFFPFFKEEAVQQMLLAPFVVAKAKRLAKELHSACALAPEQQQAKRADAQKEKREAGE